jgi:transcriptional regulator with XRE-family HTH domain
MELSRTFRENLKQYLRDKKIKQKDLAARLGISDASVSILLNRESPVGLDTVERIAEVLGKSALWFLTPSNPEPAEKILVSST